MTAMIDLARTAHALSDPLRVRILDLLTQARRKQCCSPANEDLPGAICACDLAPQLDDMAPSKLAYHLKILRETNLIVDQRRGKWVYYTLNTETVESFAHAATQRFRVRRPATSGKRRSGCCKPAAAGK